MAFKSLTNKDKKELRDIIDQMTAVSVDSFEKVEMAIALGCPRGQFMSVVNMKTENDSIELKPLLNNLKTKVNEKLGDGAFDEEEVTLLIESLVRNNHDLIHFRKLVSGFSVSAFVINKIVEIRTRSPLDSGKALFSELFHIEGVDPTEEELVGENVNSGGVEEGGAEKESIGTYFNPETRKMVMDIALGVGLGVSAIALLV